MKRHNTTKKIMYPLFDSIATIATDPWWAEYLRTCARGGLPKGVSLNGSVITYSYMSDVAHYHLSPSPENAYQELCAFFSQYLRVTPTKDGGVTERDSGKKKGKKVSTTKASTVRKEVAGWKGIKSKHRRAALLSRFIETVQETYSLNREQLDELAYVLYMADIKDAIDTTIKMENGLISSIGCLDYDGEHFHLRERPKEQRCIRIPPPSNPIYKGYPTKQVDPDALFSTHFTHLKKHNTASTVQKASSFIDESHREDDKEKLE